MNNKATHILFSEYEVQNLIEENTNNFHEIVNEANFQFSKLSSAFQLDSLEKSIKVIYKNGYFISKEDVRQHEAQLSFSIMNGNHLNQLTKIIKNIKNIEQITILAGHWTQPNTIAQQILYDSFDDSRQSFTYEKLTKQFSKSIYSLFVTEIEFTRTCRILGVKLLDVETINFEEGVSINKLNENELNGQEQVIHASSAKMGIPIQLIDSEFNSEIKVQAKIQIKQGEEDDFFKEANKFSTLAREKILSVINSLHLYKTYELGVGKQIETNSYIQGYVLEFGSGMKKILSPINVPYIIASDVDQVIKSYHVLEKVKEQDLILERSLTRFILSCEKIVLEEKIVDLVIALESILQTVEGSSNKSELIYRFSLNGASLWCVVDPSSDFYENMEIMKEIYNCRSTIVHGGKTEEQQKQINKLNKKLTSKSFNDLSELVDCVSNAYRLFIHWLVSLNVENRPYNQKYGWEKLLREDFE